MQPEQTVEAQEAKQREENAKKAKAAADLLFPNEKWEKLEDGIYKAGKKRSFEEINDARILRDLGSAIYFVPENTRALGKKFDAIVNGLQFEFKNVSGNANTLAAQFLRSRSQAPNVFINLESSSLKRGEIIKALYNARNSIMRIGPNGNIIKGYEEINKFKGGLIILKINEHENLVYLSVEDLKAP